MRLLRPAVAGLALAVGAASVSRAQGTAPRTGRECAALRALALPSTTITVADSLSGSFTLPGTRDTIRDLPPFCRVAGEIRPTVDSRIAFEVWLPLAGWNGKFAGVGNGGWAGTIAYAGPPIATLSDQLRRGYAAASTNTGHEGNGGDASFAYGHPERLADFGWRAVHEMTVKAKDVTRAFYGRAPRHAYWIGCSTGGKQGLTEAQRFPADYDGIVAGAPASVWTPLMAATFDMALATQVDSASYLPRPALVTLRRAVLAACDTLDGLRDSLLADPRRCRFDPATLQCPPPTAQPADGCLTAGQAAAVARIYGGVADPVTGRRVAPGLVPGSELGWVGWTTPGRPFPIPLSYYKYLVFGDTARDWKTFDLREPSDRAAFLAADAKHAPVLAATDPDLRAFRARGGKLIQYHGWDDQLITPLFSTDYYDRVVARGLGAGRDSAAALRDVQQFYRLFMVPGMAHCGGGPGPNAFDMEHALEAWVERGVAPDTVVAAHYTNGRPDRRRPLCPYPTVAVYKREGDANDAASFACRER